MRPTLSNRSLLATLALALSAASAVACSQGSSSPLTVGHPGEGESSSSGGGGGDDNAGSSGGAGGTSSGTSSGTPTSSGGGSSGATGASSGSSSGASGPPPSQPPAPNGFQLTIAPLLDAQGCTECHHHGRPIDLTTYPFMTGTAAVTTQALVTAFTTNMPPAPRTAVPQSVIDQVNAWAAAGMKP